MAAAGTAFTVEMGEEMYSLVAPDGTPGEPVEYGTTATITWNSILYYVHVDDPDGYPEGGESPTVFRVDSTTVMESAMEEVSDEDQEKETLLLPEGEEDEEDEEDEEEEEEDEEPGPGDVIEFPEPEEMDEDEDLPPAEDINNG